MRKLILGVLLLLGLGATGALAQEQDSAVIPGGPEIPKAIGPGHAEGNAYWRANHMKLLKHDRDLTMHLGERDIQASIKQCVTCHATKGPDARPLPVNAPGQFCATCHEYAAVKLDCFECHSTKPDVDTARLLATKFPDSADLAALAEYLSGVKE